MMDQTWRALPVCLLLTPGAAPAAGSEDRIGDWAYRSGSGRDGAGFAASADAPGKGSLVFACDAPGPGSVHVSFVAQEYLGGVSAIKRCSSSGWTTGRSSPVSGGTPGTSPTTVTTSKPCGWL